MIAPPHLVLGTPLEDHLAALGLLVKREDLSCPPPGPPFSKTRGVYAHVKARYDEGVRTFGVLDTSHSQGGHAVAQACSLLPGSRCVVYYPLRKAEDPEFLRQPQRMAQVLGAALLPLPAGRSAILYHAARKDVEGLGGYMMPNALKLAETVRETSVEVHRTFDAATDDQWELMKTLPWIVSASSATIAAGVLRGLHFRGGSNPHLIVHLGYSRSHSEVLSYVDKAADLAGPHNVEIVDEGYGYADEARAGPTPPWPCNPHYDLKALRWWLRDGRRQHGHAVFWNVG